MKKLVVVVVVLLVVLIGGLFALELLAARKSARPQPGTVDDEALAAGREAASFPGADEDYFHAMDYGLTEDPEAVRAALDPYLPGIDAEEARQAVVRGRNNWIVWTAGNDRFWDYISRESLGALDLLKTVSNHPSLKFSRDNRWQYLGLVNEPCFDKAAGPDPDRHGLWLDVRRPDCPPDPFENEEKYPGVRTGARGENLPVGSYYGWGTGIVGLRLFPNPDFDEAAEEEWDPERYYTDPAYYLRRDLVKPYRVGMSCGFCHVGPNPTNPPADPENPTWANLNSNPGAQYFWIDRIFMWRPDEANFAWQLFHTSRPGALDTSFVSSDQINNPRTMNAVYDLAARLEIATKWGREKLDGGGLDNAQLNDYVPAGSPLAAFYEKPDRVFTPRVLKDGADSVGALGALNRVFINIGLFSEEWVLHFKPLVGGAHITPIQIADAERNSSYWKATEAQTPSTALFFLATARPDYLAVASQRAAPAVGAGDLELAAADAGGSADGAATPNGGRANGSGTASAAAPAAAGEAPPAAVRGDQAAGTEGPGGPAANGTREARLAWFPSAAREAYAAAPERGKEVFATYCARCHSSKLPEKAFTDFFPDGGCIGPDYLPCWNDYWRWTKSEEFRTAMREIVMRDDFLAGNFLSTELRVPVTLLETNACSPLATNAIEGNIWDNFSSASYKSLPSVGTIRVQHPYTGAVSEYEMPGGGRGFTRPASLISVWSTAPLLLNNTLGPFHWSGSLEDRLASFDASIAQLLWPQRRDGDFEVVTASGRRHPGIIDRTTGSSSLEVAAGFVPAELNRLTGFFDRLLPNSLLAKVRGMDGGISIGPVPAGTPVNLLSNIDLSKEKEVKRLGLAIIRDLKKLPRDATDEQASEQFAPLVPRLLAVSKCPDFVVNRGHYFGTDYLPAAEGELPLTDADKQALIALLKTF
jgi:mono/diheme cytochrome c family protein